MHPSPQGRVVNQLGTGRHCELTEPIVASLGVEMLLALECGKAPTPPRHFLDISWLLLGSGLQSTVAFDYN